MNSPIVGRKVDILVLGATGYTGKLVVQYLALHPQRDSFSLGIGGRSLQKLQLLSKEIPNSPNVSVSCFDTTNYSEVERVVKTAKVIVNCIGPFFKWGTPVVRACARNGVHYVDITAEPWWVKEIIQDWDLEASKTKAIIIPASGNDSIPSDLCVYLSARALAKKGTKVSIGKSLTAMSVPDFDLSGGTLGTIISGLEDVPQTKLRGMKTPDWLSPVHSAVSVPSKMAWNLPFTKIYGGMSPVAAINEKIVYRTWGLFEARSLSTAHKDTETIRYGANFQYDDEVMMMHIQPLRWLLKRFGPQPGTGPKPYDGAVMTLTNVTSTDGPDPDYVQTTVTFKSAAYPMTALLLGESALALLLDHDSLTSLAKEGGILTPMSALGDTLVKRLVGTGLVTHETKALNPKKAA